MELKYPKLCSGLKMMCASWWISIAGSMLGGMLSAVIALIIVLYESMIAVIAAFVVLFAIEIAIYGLQVAGLYKASKDDSRYKKLFYMLVTELGASGMICVSLLAKSRVLLIVTVLIGALICIVFELLRFFLFVKYTETLALANANKGIKGFYKAMCIISLACFITLIMACILMATESMIWLGGFFMFLAMIYELAVFVLYIIFLHKAINIFKKLEKRKEEDAIYGV